MDGTTKIVELKGIGEKSATAFGRLGIRDVDSLITMYPKYYLTYEDPKDVALFSPIPFNSMIFVVPSIFCLLQNSLSYSHEKQRNPAIKRDFPSSLILLIIRNNKLAVRHILTVHHSHHMFLLLSQVMLLPVLWLCLLHSKY